MVNGKKMFLILLILLYPFLSMGNPDFKEVKARQLKKLESQLTLINENKSCIQGASNLQGIETCKKTMKKKMRALRKSEKKKKRVQILKKIEKACRAIKMKSNKRKVNLADVRKGV